MVMMDYKIIKDDEIVKALNSQRTDPCFVISNTKTMTPPLAIFGG